ncbi:type II toxin-antitoxin system RelE/ParE family toxin [Candidatus Woesearchaeota archaeon]|nr:type II toxin-antitoxin system RelE/ParE family toxin [Candidatus Woesearchaeota archaeon]
MDYAIRWSKKAEKFLEKLPPDTASRIAHKVDSIAADPFHFLEHYEGENYFKLRIGDYRALIDVDTSLRVIDVRIVGHRRNIYLKD